MQILGRQSNCWGAICKITGYICAVIYRRDCNHRDTSEVTSDWLEWVLITTKQRPCSFSQSCKTHLGWLSAQAFILWWGLCCYCLYVAVSTLLGYSQKRRIAVILLDCSGSLCAAWVYRRGLSHFQHHLRAHHQSACPWEESLTCCKELFSGTFLKPSYHSQPFLSLSSMASFRRRGFLQLQPPEKTFLYLFIGSPSQLESYLSFLASVS